MTATENRTAPARTESPIPGSNRPSTATTGTLRTVWLVARRELRTRVRTRAFVLGTLSILVLMAGMPLLFAFIGSSSSTTTVGLTARTAAIAQPLNSVAQARGLQVETQQVSDPAAGEQQVREGELDALVTGTSGDLTLVVQSTPDGQLRAALNSVVQQRALNARLEQAGLDPAAVQAAVASAQVRVDSLEPADPMQAQRLAMAMAAAFLLYIFLITGSQMISQGVVEEKSSRVVEILLSTIRPTHLLAGKVLGIGLTSLLQFVIIGVVGVVAVISAGIMTLPSATLISTLLWAVVWFLLGYLFYATILAAGSSLVSRQEDLQSVVTPVIMMLVVPFFIGVSVLPANPDSTLGAVLSLIPGFSPVLMPMRIALGTALPWQIALSLALSLLATAGLLWLGGRIYRNAVLRTGARVKLTEALRAA